MSLLLQRKVNLEHIGRKAGIGWYKHDERTLAGRFFNRICSSRYLYAFWEIVGQQLTALA
jgi:hypothetical protein